MRPTRSASAPSSAPSFSPASVPSSASRPAHWSVRPAFRRIAVACVPILVALTLGGAVAGCSGGPRGSGGAAGPDGSGGGGHATMTPVATTDGQGGGAGGGGGGSAMPGPMGGMHTAEQVQTAWDARPDYVKSAEPRTVEAYAYALTQGDVLEWMPCYCGCVAMDHRHNLDCFFKPHVIGSLPRFEEHASFCKICIDIALRAKGMQADGSSLVEIRAAVDAEFGARAPGTRTELPPAGS